MATELTPATRIGTQLSRARRQIKLADLTARLLLGLLAAVLFVMATVAIDHWVADIGAFGRWALLVTLVGGAVWYMVRHVAWQALRAINPVYAARLIENAEPSLRNGLINYLLLRQQPAGVSEPVMRTIEYRAADDIAQVDTASAVDFSPAIRLGYALAAAAVLIGAYKILSPKDPLPSVQRLLAPWADIARPARVRILEVLPGDATIYLGDTATVAARIEGARPSDAVELVFSTEDGQTVERRVAMETGVDGRTWSAKLPPGADGLRQSLSYRVEAGDAISPPYRLTATAAPRILVDRVEYTYRAYTKRPRRIVDQQGDLSGWEGTNILLVATANQPIRAAWIEFDPASDGGPPTPADRVLHLHVDGRTARQKFNLELASDRAGPRFTSYVVRFETPDGKRSTNSIIHQIEVLPDVPPEVEILAPAEARVRIPEDGRLSMEIRAVDPDFGLAQLAIEARSQRAQAEFFHELAADPAGLAGPIQRQWNFIPREHGLRAGDQLRLVAVARDNRPGAVPPPIAATPANKAFPTAPAAATASAIPAVPAVPAVPLVGESRSRELLVEILPPEKPAAKPDRANSQKPEPSADKQSGMPPATPGPDAKPQPKSEKGQPDNNKAGASKPGENKPENDSPNAGKPDDPPDSGKPAQPPAGKAQPEKGQPEEEQPNAAQPERGQPDKSPSGEMPPAEDKPAPPKPMRENPQAKDPENTKAPQQEGKSPDEGASQSESGMNSKQPKPSSGAKPSDGQSASDDSAKSQQSGGQASGKPSSGQQPSGDKPGDKPGEKQAGGKQSGGNSPGGNSPGGGQSGANQSAGQPSSGEAAGGQSSSKQPVSGKNAPGGRDTPGSQDAPSSKPASPQPDAGGRARPAQDDGEAFERALEFLKQQQPDTQERDPLRQPRQPNQDEPGAGNSPPEAAPKPNPKPFPSPEKGPAPSSEQGTQKSTGGNPSQSALNNARESENASPPKGDKPNEVTAKRKPVPPQGSAGQSGAGQASKDQAAPPDPKEQNVDRNKKMMPDSNEPTDASDFPDASQSKRQSDSQGESDGDRSGGGKRGGGQGAKQAGNDTAGSSSPGDDGAGQAKEKGNGETSGRAGDQARGKVPDQPRRPNDSPPPPDSNPGAEKGPGARKAPGQSNAGGADPTGQNPQNQNPPDKDPNTDNPGRNGADDMNSSAKPTRPPPAKADGPERTPTGKSPPLPASDPTRNPAAKPPNSLPDNRPESGPPDSALPDPSTGRVPPPGDERRTGGGGVAGNPPSARRPADGRVAEGEEANLDYANRATDLVLDYLKDQKEAPNQELLDRLGWSAEDLRKFVNRWEALKRSAIEPDPSTRRELSDSLRSLGLRPATDRRRAVNASNDVLRGNRDAGGRSDPPAKYQERFNAYRRGAGQ